MEQIDEVPITSRAAWASDRARYGERAFLREPAIYAVVVLRAGQAAARSSLPAPMKRLLGACYWAVFRLLEVALGVSINRNTVVGPGLRIHHFGGIFINEGSVLGARCTLRQGVTIGSRHDLGGCPRLGDDVDVGAYAQILGDITVGDGAKIGAMAVVLRDVPPGARVAGNPARILEPKT